MPATATISPTTAAAPEQDPTPMTTGAPAATAPPEEPPGPPEGAMGDERGRPGRSRRAVTALLAALVMAGGGYGLRVATDRPAAAPTTSASSSTAVATSQQTGDVSALVQRAEKAVVKITSQVNQQTIFGPTSGEAVGTGFIVSSNGLILTNYHVVEGADGITVTLSDGRTYPATVVKADSPADLAVLRIDATGLSTLTLGDSSEVLAGESVVAIGYALDLEGSPTVTTGIVSATGRTIQVQDSSSSGPIVRTYSNVLQISAAINSGNSGGPLLDMQGRVIGIDAAGAQGADNIGFAIPVDQAKDLIASAA